MKRFFLGVWAVVLTANLGMAGIGSKLFFPPRELAVGELGAPVRHVALVRHGGAATAYAANVLAHVWKDSSNGPARFADDLAGEGTGDWIVLETRQYATTQRRLAPEMAKRLAGPESFVLQSLSLPKGRLVLVLGEDDAGVLYGAQTLAGLLRVTGGRLPKKLSAADAPDMAIRAKCGGIRTLDQNLLKRLDFWAQWRLNTGYYEIDGAKKQKEVPPEFPKMVEECTKRGIQLYGCLSQWRSHRYFGKSLDPTDPTHIAYIDHLLEGLAKGGAKGLIFLFDDIVSEDVLAVDGYRARNPALNDLADVQMFWLDRMLKVGRAHGIENVIMCPTPYHKSLTVGVPSGFDSLAYYRKLGPYCAKNRIRIYHCSFRESSLKPLFDAGVETYIWWHNGGFDLARTLKGLDWTVPPGYYGLSRVVFGWYMLERKGGTGIGFCTDLAKSMRHLPKLTNEAWLCGSAEAQWGMYLWRAQTADCEHDFRLLVDDLFGAGAADDYLQWEQIVRRWGERRSGGRKITPGENAPEQKLVLKTLAADTEVATTVLERLANSAEKRKERKPPLDAMRHQVESLRTTLKNMREGRVEAEVGKERTRPDVQEAVRCERTIVCSSPWADYRMRHVLIREKDNRLHRAKWHFGSGLGLRTPSLRNWYDAGFMDVLLNGTSLDDTMPEWSETKLADGRFAARGVWKTPRGIVTVTFAVTKDNGLGMVGTVEGAAADATLELVLWCLPGTGNEKDMRKRLTTPLRTEKASKTIVLDVSRECAVVLYDETYDMPNPKGCGPAAFRFDSGAPDKASVQLSGYISTVRLEYGADRRFHAVVYDYGGCTNAEVLAYYQKNGVSPQ